MLIFRGFATLGIPAFAAIVVNYVTSFFLGWLLWKDEFSIGDLFAMNWTRYLLILGVLFIVIFNLMARVAREYGISVSSIAAKMSLVVPVVVFLIIDPEDRLTFWKFAGLLAAVSGVILTSLKPDFKGKGVSLFGLPLIVLLGSGIIDLTLGYFSDSDHITSESALYVLSSTPFLGAGIIGVSTLTIQRLRGKSPKGWMWIPGGIILGAVNLLSIVAIVKVLESGWMEKSEVFPINNVGIVLLSAALSFLIFRERFSSRNVVGLALGVLAIVLLALPAS